MASAHTKFYRYYKGPALLFPTMPDSGIDAVKTFKYRDDDILIASYPKSGTHWINEVVQLMIHAGDPQQLDDRHRRLALELEASMHLSKPGQVKPSVLLVHEDPSPRVLMTHLTPGYLSEETWKKKIPFDSVVQICYNNKNQLKIKKNIMRQVWKPLDNVCCLNVSSCIHWTGFGKTNPSFWKIEKLAQIIYIIRDPRDVCLSFYKFLKLHVVGENESFLEGVSFKQFLSEFMEGTVPFSGWCEHALSYEDCWRKEENILFITYEEMKQDLPIAIKKIAKHIGCERGDDVMDKVIANSTKEAMEKNYTDKADNTNKFKPDVYKFVNRGASGYQEVDWSELNVIFKEKVKNSEFARKYFDW